jgi:hypothetical protein
VKSDGVKHSQRKRHGILPFVFLLDAEVQLTMVFTSHMTLQFRKRSEKFNWILSHASIYRNTVIDTLSFVFV